METSLKTGFAQIFSCCPKNLSYPNFGGAAAPLAPPARTPMCLGVFVQQLIQSLKFFCGLLRAFFVCNERREGGIVT